MKKLTNTILLLLLVFICNAQKIDTVGDICIPYPIIKSIQTDLLIGDSAKAMLSLTEFELNLTKQKLSYKDSLILNGKMKEINLIEQIKNEKFQKEYYVSLYNTSEKNYTALEKTFKRYKTKKTFTDILFIGATSVLTGTLIYIKTK